MRGTSRSSEVGRGPSLVGVLGMSLLCLGLVAGHAWAQAKDRPAGPAAKQPAKLRGGGAPFEMNPDAKWACDQTASIHKPVWRGHQDLTFSFRIRNQGTADLKIRAGGG